MRRHGKPERAQTERDVARRVAAREEAVRYQLTRLFRSAIADHGSGQPTAKGMIDASAQRVLREYRDDPQLTGKIVLTLADLYRTLEDVEGSAALLEGYLREARPELDPGDVADARQKFAAIEILRGHVARADQLLTQAESFWKSVPGEYAEERLEGLGIRARQQRAVGDLDRAIATTRTAIEQRTALSGHVHRETAILTNSYGKVLTAAHRLTEALAAYRETLAIYRALGLGEELDAQIVLANTGTLEMRTGHLREAETTLKGAIEHERALAGNSAAVAAALGNYGKVLLLEGRPEQALPPLREATELGTRYAGKASPVAVQNRLFFGEAQLAAGDRATARATLTENYETAKAQYGAENPLTLCTELALARLTIAEGHRSDAQTQLLGIIPALQRKGVEVQDELAEAQALLTDLQSSTRQVPQAHGTTTPGP